MKRILFTHNNFIPYFVTGRGIAMFSYLTLGTNRAMFTYLTQGTNRIMYYSTKASYSKEMGVIYINFTKALLHNKLNLDKNRFDKNAKIIDFLEGFQGDKLFTRHHITKLKNQGEFDRVPLTPKSKEFINYVKREFPDFDGFEFALVKPITKEEGKSQLIINKSTTKHVPARESVKTVSQVLPTIVQKESTVVSSKATPTVTETITKIVEPVVTETITKVVEPVVKVVETITKPVVDTIPNITINNANTNSAHATTVTSNTQYASSSWDSLLSLFGLKSIAKILKDIFGFDGDGIIYLLIQLPYLVWFLIAFKDNPDIMKYLTENLGIEEYQAPNTELIPLEYNFEVPYDFEQDDSNIIDVASEDYFTKDAARDYTDNSGIEYFDYFDYYHSKPLQPSQSSSLAMGDNETTPTSKVVVEELKDIGNSLLEPIKDQPEVHVVDDQFSGTIDVFPVAQEVQSMNNYKITSNSNKTSIGGFFRWLFPMLDFYNLNYFPSYFEKFNMNTKVQPITNKVDYVKMLIDELYYTLNLGKFEVPRVKFNLPEFGRGRGAQSHADTLSALEGLNTNNNARRTPNWRNTSLISDNTSFSTYFNKDWNKPRDVLLGRLPSVNSSPNDLLLNFRDSGSTRTVPTTPLVIDTNNNVDNSWFYDSSLPSVNSTPIRPITMYSDYYEEVSNTTNALATKLDTKIGIHDLLNIKSAIVEVDTKIVKLKDQFIEFHHKINRFDEQIAQLDTQKLHFTEKFNKGKLSASDWGQLKDVKKQLDYVLDAKANLEASYHLNNDELKSLEIKKSSLLELKNKYEKILGNIATTPNV